MTTLLTGGSPRGRETLDDDVDLARDRALVTRAQGGDRGAFDDLYLRYFRRLYRFCLRRLHDSHEAEDVAQEAFARAWRALPTFGGDRRFYPWLSVIASHLCTDVLRRRSRSTPVAEFHQSNMASLEDGGEEIMLAAVDSDLVAKAFTKLSDRHQRILHLREGSGWSYQRIADHEGVGITAVETLLWRARQALKREFASLAGADGRTAAWIGGVLSLASLRRLLRIPNRAVHRLAATGGKGVALAAGSAVAATAMVIGATLSAPVTGGSGGSVPTVSGGIGSNGGAVSAPAGATSATSGTAGSTSGTAGSTSGAATSKSRGTVPGLPSQLSTPTNPLGPVGAGPNNTVTSIGGTVQNVGGILNNGVSGAGNQIGNAVSGVAGSVVNGVAGTTLGGAGSAVTDPLTSITALLNGSGTSAGTTSAGTTSGSGLLGGTLGHGTGPAGALLGGI